MNPEYVLECNELKKTYQENHGKLVVFDGLNLTVAKGERIAIIGSSGSGKTTLLNVLAGLDSLDGGKVLVCGQDIHKLSEGKKGVLRNKHLGFVYQFHHLLPEFSAEDNVALPLLLRKSVEVAVARDQARGLLGQLGLSERLLHKPSELSGGERQRVAFARAVVTKPSLVLLDEPTGNLDRETAWSMQNLMVDISKKWTISFVVVTHDTDLAAKMDRILCLRSINSTTVLVPPESEEIY